MSCVFKTSAQKYLGISDKILEIFQKFKYFVISLFLNVYFLFIILKNIACEWIITMKDLYKFSVCFIYIFAYFLIFQIFTPDFLQMIKKKKNLNVS